MLSMIVSAAALGAALNASATVALEAARNRINLTRAAWVAEGSLEGARATIDAILADDALASAGWRALDGLIPHPIPTLGVPSILSRQAFG